MRSVPLVRARYFLWAALPLAGFAMMQAFGSPHVIWAYKWTGSRYVGDGPRYYTSCTYVGPHGSFTRPASGGECPWLQFRKDWTGS